MKVPQLPPVPPERMPFVVLVRWLEHALEHASHGESRGSGGVRFGADASLGFPVSDVASLELQPTHASVRLRFGSLLGAGSPLPAGMIERFAGDDDDTLLESAFLDLFHHRLYTLAYQGLLKFDLARAPLGRAPPPVLDWLLALAGLDGTMAGGVERTTGLPRTLLLRLLPLLVAYPPNAERLRLALACALDAVLGPTQIQVRELQGGYVALDARHRPKLGADLRLGAALLGARAHAPCSGVTIELGPLSPEACARLSPGGELRGRLEATVALCCPETLDVELRLQPQRVQAFALGAKDARLGRRSWLATASRPAPLRWQLDRSARSDASIDHGSTAWTSPH